MPRLEDLRGLRATKYGADLRGRGPWARTQASAYVAGLSIVDLVEWATGRADRLMPPRRHRRFIGRGDFAKVGRTITTHLVDEIGLKPSDDVLDVGCGAGRVAIPLTRILDSGSYLGFDLVPHAIRWCQRAITPYHPSFTFRWVDVRQDIYNPGGMLSASELRFPAADERFDLVLLIGVVNCLFPAEVDNYLRETARVLRPGGRCFLTAYVLDDGAIERVRRGETALSFTVNRGDYWLHSEREPTYAMAHRLDYLTATAARYGLRLARPPLVGSWSTQPVRPASQDSLVFAK